MPEGDIDRLVKFGSAALGEASGLDVSDPSPIPGSGLDQLLTRRNGFYAFESALHVFPSGDSQHTNVQIWNHPDLWRGRYGDMTNDLFFFAEDIFGIQFAISPEGICQFDPETADVTVIAPNIDGWGKAILSDRDFLTGYPLAHEWQTAQGPLEVGRRLLPKTPFVAGGTFEISNLYAGDAIEGMRFRAHLAESIRHLPDGTKIRFRIEE